MRVPLGPICTRSSRRQLSATSNAYMWIINRSIRFRKLCLDLPRAGSFCHCARANLSVNQQNSVCHQSCNDSLRATYTQLHALCLQPVAFPLSLLRQNDITYLVHPTRLPPPSHALAGSSPKYSRLTQAYHARPALSSARAHREPSYPSPAHGLSLLFVFQHGGPLHRRGASPVVRALFAKIL
ncbi:hypothetical protein BD779DRAFT_1557901, partial [Infundibulicybe gibba]